MSEHTDQRVIFGFPSEESAKAHVAFLQRIGSPPAMATVMGFQVGDDPVAMPRVYLAWPADQFCPCCGRYPDGRSAYSEAKAEENAQA